MKILYTIHMFYPETVGGTEKVIFNIASYNNSNENNVVVATYSNYEDSFYDNKSNNILYKKFQYRGLEVIAYKLMYDIVQTEYRFDNEDIYFFANEILELVKPDIVHIGYPHRTAEFSKAAKEKKIPYMITLTDYLLMCPRFNLLTEDFELCCGKTQNNECKMFCNSIENSNEYYEKTYEILKDAHKLVAPSLFLKNMFLKQFPFLDIKIIKHGIDRNSKFTDGKRYSGGDLIKFGYLGGVNFIKGLYTLLDAFRYVKDDRTVLKLYGFEEDDVCDYYINQYKINNIEKCGVYSPDDIATVLSGIDVLIVPSICYESYSMVIHEALIYNIPVITTNEGVFGEIVKNCYNGFSFAPSDYVGLKNIIYFIINEPEVLNYIKKNIENEKINSVSDECKEYDILYKNIISDDITCSEEITAENSSSFEAEWDSLMNEIKKDYPLTKEFIEKMKIRIRFLREIYKEKEIKYLIWGAGSSGKVTKLILEKFLPYFKLQCFVDKFKTGKIEGFNIYNPMNIKNIDVDRYVISTTLGKKDAFEYLQSIGLKSHGNIIYGYGL